jgi:hypothetical protein
MEERWLFPGTKPGKPNAGVKRRINGGAGP